MVARRKCFPRKRNWAIRARGDVGGRCGGTEGRESCEREKDLDASELHDAVNMLVRFPSPLLIAGTTGTGGQAATDNNNGF